MSEFFVISDVKVNGTLYNGYVSWPQVQLFLLLLPPSVLYQQFSYWFCAVSRPYVNTDFHEMILYVCRHEKLINKQLNANINLVETLTIFISEKVIYCSWCKNKIKPNSFKKNRVSFFPYKSTILKNVILDEQVGYYLLNVV